MNDKLPAAPRQYHMVADADALFDTAQFEHMARVAGMMARSTLMPTHLRVMRTEDGRMIEPGERPQNVALFLDEAATTANAFLIVNQARLFGGIDPFALAQVSYFVHGRLGYEGKLVQAVLERRIGAMDYEYFGTPGDLKYGISITALQPGTDRQRTIKGTVEEWQTKKSNGEVLAQWKGPAGQTRMLHYRGTREWARLYAPGLVLGLLDDDDLDAIREDSRALRARPVQQAVPYNPMRQAPVDKADNDLMDALRSAGHGEDFAAEVVAEVRNRMAEADRRKAAAPGGRDPEEADHVGLARPSGVRPTEEVPGEATGPDRSPFADMPHDPETGEVQPPASGQKTAASGQGAAEPSPGPAAAPAAAGEAAEAKPATKRLPRGMPQRVDIACMELARALDYAGLQTAWDQYAEPIIHDIRTGGYPEPAIDRLKEAKTMRRDAIARMERANIPADKSAEAPAPIATPGAPAEATADQVEQPAPAEEAEDWSPFLHNLRGLLAVARSFEDVDEVVDSQTDSRDMPRDVQQQVDDMVDDRRREIGAENAAVSSAAQPDPVSADPAGPEVPHTSGENVHTPGAEELPPSQEQVIERVDGWIADMRKLKTVEELEKYNEDVVSPFVQGKWGKLIPTDVLDDASHTFKTRRKLLAAK